MKKIRRLAALLLALTVIFSAFTTVSAAGVTFPEALTAIEDEAFADSELFQGLVDVPSGVTHIGSNAFGSGVYALKIPQTVKTLDAQTASEMAYIYLNSSTLPSSLTNEINARYLFSQAAYANMWAPFIGASFVNALSLQEYDGFYYQINPDTNRLKLLCAVDNTAVPESVTIPENIFGRSVEALSPNAFFGCEHVTSITLMGSPEEQEGCFDGAPNAVVNHHVDPEISLQLADGFAADWFSEIPVQLKNTSYEAGSASIACTVEFVNYSGQVLFKVENAASLSIPQPFAATEHTIAVDNQLWARAYQAGSRVLRISLAPEAGVPVAANEHSITIELPYTPSCPIVLLEYSETAKPNSDYVVKATCLNPEAMKEYRPVELCDANGNQLAVCYIGTYHPNGEIKATVGQEAPSYIVRYPGANGATYTHAINPALSALTGVSGADSTGVALGVGQNFTVECTYAGAMPQITCTSGNTAVAAVQLSGSTITITGVGSGSTNITVTDGTTSFTIPVTVQTPTITAIYYNGVRVDDGTRITFDRSEPVTLNCTTTGGVPQIRCYSWDTSIVTAAVDGANILLTGVRRGSTYVNVLSSNGLFTTLYVTVETGTITGIYNTDGTSGYKQTYLNAGETHTLSYTYTGSMPDATCTSTNESVATVQVDGTTITITAVGSGSAFINISDGSGMGWSIPVTVASGEITGISQIYAVSVNVGETSTLVVDYTGSPVITCTSFNEGIATIERDDRYILVHGVSAGATSVEIRDDSGNAYYFTVRVSDVNASFIPFELTGFNFGNDATATVGQAVKLYTQYTLGSGLQDPSALTCTSSDESIAKVMGGDIDGFTVLGMSAGTVQLTATDGQNSFTINMTVTPKAVPTFELVMENDGATINNESHNPIKLRSDMPEDQFVMPGSIRLEGRFFAEDGTFLRKYVWYANPLDAPGITDQTITLQHHYYDEMYTWGASYVQVRPIQPYADAVGNYSLEYFVKNPDQYLTLYLPPVSAVNYPIYTLRTDVPMVDHQIVVPPGTEVELTLECLNPYYFYGYTYPVFQVHPDGTETEIGAMSRGNYSMTITVPPQDVSTYTAFFRVPWFTSEGRAEIDIQYVAFEMEDMVVPVGVSMPITYTSSSNLRPAFTIADETIATVQNNLVTGVAPGTTTVTLQYGSITETAQVHVYDPQISQKSVLSFAEEQQAWPWAQEGIDWPIRLKASKSAQEAVGKANVDITVAFKDAQNNTIETVRKGMITDFGDRREAEDSISLNKAMLSRLASCGVVKAVVQIEAVRGMFTFDADNRTVEIAMDDLANYADYPMFHVVNNNSNDLKMGDTASFTLHGNPAADRDYNILISYTPGSIDAAQTIRMTYNPARDGAKEITMTVPQFFIPGQNSFNVRFQYEDPNNQNVLTEITNTWVYVAQ